MKAQRYNAKGDYPKDGTLTSPFEIIFWVDVLLMYCLFMTV